MTATPTNSGHALRISDIVVQFSALYVERAAFSLPIYPGVAMFARVTVETFKPEIDDALRAFDKYVICIDRIPEEFEASLLSLVSKAIKAFESRGPNLRHGIALDRFVTVILSQGDGPRPLCGIYFNLHSPYHKQVLPSTVKAISEPISEHRETSEG